MDHSRKLVYIRWKDAVHGMEDSAIESLGGLVDLEEVGWLIKETPEAVTITMERMEGQLSARLWLTIPRVNILEMKVTSLKRAFPTPRPSSK